MKQRQIVFIGLAELDIVERDLPSPSSTQALVRTEVTQMSTGTENICFNRLFAPGTHWDQWVKYPHEPGYSAIGVVEAVGSEVTTLKAGDRVAHQMGHASCHLVEEGRCYKAPASVSSEHAVWFTLAQIAFNGARCVGFGLGDRVAVVGAGPIGQMSLRWAIAAGAEETVVIDAMKSRLAIATKGGATYTLGCPVAEAKPKVQELLGRLPDVVVDATGHASVFEAAIGLVKTKGRLLLIGDTGTPSDQRLTGDLLRRAITIHGAHGQTTFSDRDWNQIAQLFFRLVAEGRINMDGLNTHSFSPDEAKEAYRIANELRHETMGIFFRWE